MMQERYEAAKAATGPDVICLFRSGDFYEALHGDAEKIADEIGLTLTANRDGARMAGFQCRQLDRYLAALIAAGYRCAVVE